MNLRLIRHQACRCTCFGNDKPSAKVPKAIVIKKLLRDAVKEAMVAKEFATSDKALTTFETVVDLEYALCKELHNRPDSELEKICVEHPWLDECRVYDT